VPLSLRSPNTCLLLRSPNRFAAHRLRFYWFRIFYRYHSHNIVPEFLRRCYDRCFLVPDLASEPLLLRFRSGDSHLEPFTAFLLMGGHVMALPCLALWVAFSPSTLVQFQWVAIQALPLSVRVTLGPSTVIIPHFPARTNCAVEAHQPLMGNWVKTCALSPVNLD
jgi:hypothetical protein